MHAILNSVLSFIHGDGLTVLPEMELLLFALGILLFDFLLEPQEKRFNGALALTGLAASGIGLSMQVQRYNPTRTEASGPPGLIGFHNSILIDGFFVFFAILFLCMAALVVLLSIRYLDLEDHQEGEFYSLILFACIGMMLLASGFDLVVLFVGLEITSLSLYLLVGFFRGNRRSSEAAVKYFVLGFFSSGILAYGFSLLYGMTASTNIFQIGDMLDRRLRYTLAHNQVDWLFVLSFVIVTGALFFKIAAAPFHQWIADVGEGAPAPVSAFVNVAAVTAGFALFLRLIFFVFGSSHPTWVSLVAVIAITSLAWGNLAAMTQNNLKRLLAYSSVAQVGYMLLGLVGWDPAMQSNTAVTGIFYYLMAYGFMTMGMFAVVIVLHGRGVIGETIGKLDGLYQRSPVAAVLLLIFICSLAGIPPTAGFFSKYFIFQSLLETHHPLIAICAVLFTLPGLYTYFRVVHHAWTRNPVESAGPSLSSAQAVALGVTLFVTLTAGIYPEPFIRLARYAFGQ
jgi:NADH-quinone oxidoreductase subunit N